MKRKDFIKIINLRSCWKIDKRKGNYKLPNGKRLSNYIRRLADSQMRIDNLGIRKNGDFCYCSGGEWNSEKKEFEDFALFPDFEEEEICTYDEMEKRIEFVVDEILGLKNFC